MTTIEREFEYKPSWTIIALAIVFFGACAIVLGISAFSNDGDLVINGIIHLSKGSATICYWVLCAMSLGFVVLAILMTIHRLTHHQRIAFTPQSILLPNSWWSSEEATVDYEDISTIAVTEINGQWILCIICDDGKRFTISASLLPTRESFDEVCDRLIDRVESKKDETT